MSSPWQDETVLKSLASLPTVRHDAERAERRRSLCRARLESPVRQTPSILEPTTIGALCAAYAWHILRFVAR